MEEKNFMQLIRLHEIYKSTQERKKGNKRRMKRLLMLSALVGVALWSYSMYGKKLFGSIPGGL